MKKISLVFALGLVACGAEESEDIVITVPKPIVVEKTVVVEKPVIIEKTVVVTPTPAPKVLQCRVYATDSYGNITYLSHDDRFYSNILMAKVFPEDEAKKMVELKDGKYNSGKSKVTYYCK